jgi:hypothetical protein
MNKGFSVLLGLLALNCAPPGRASDAVGTWTVRQPLPTANRLNGVAYGDGKYVAVGDLGTIIISTDGTNWSRVASHTKASLVGVACGDRGFVAVGEKGTILRSIHGVNWLRCPSPTKTSLAAVTYAGGRFVAVGSAILSSVDGFHWVQHTNPAVYYPLTGIAYGNGQFVAAAYGNTVTSQDGTNWAVHPNGIVVSSYPYPYQIGITYADGKFVAVGEGVAASSVDGINWEAAAEPQTEILSGVAYGNGVFAAAGGSSTATSQDGDAWNQRDLSAEITLQGIAFGNGQFVAVGWNGAIVTSADGLNWASQAKGFGPNLYAVGFGNGRFVAMGEEGTVLHSSNGAKWSRVQVEATNNLTSVTFGNGRFVAGGVAGTIATSTTGTNWVVRPSLGSYAVNLAYGNGRFVAGCGDYYMDSSGIFRPHGTLFVSTDGATWRQTVRLQDMGFFSITYGNGQFVACAALGVDDPIFQAWVSKNGVDWAKYGLPSSAYAVGFGNGRFLAAGSGENFLTSINGASWKIEKAPFDDFASGVAYANGNFFVCGEFGTLLSSPDGKRWTSYQPLSSPDFGFFGVCCGNGSCVAVGAQGAIVQARLVPGY